MFRASSLVAVVALLALAGCGGGSSGDTQAQSGPSTSEGVSTRAQSPKQVEGFGEKATGAERAAMVAALRDYLKALGARSYAAACSLLAPSVKRSIEQYAPPVLTEEGCPAYLPGELASNAAKVSRKGIGEVTAVRVGGDRGFVVFRPSGAGRRQMPVARAGGGWRVAQVEPSAFGTG